VATETKSSFSMEKVVDMLFPVLLAAVGWLLSEITSFQNRLIAIESKMPILITTDGVPTDSPISAARRQDMKDDIMADIHDLQVRVKLMEERGK
jgi:hypothetical protein